MSWLLQWKPGYYLRSHVSQDHLFVSERRKGETSIHWILFTIGQLFPMENYLQGCICVSISILKLRTGGKRYVEWDGGTVWSYSDSSKDKNQNLFFVCVKLVNLLNNIVSSINNHIITFYFGYFRQDSEWKIYAVDHSDTGKHDKDKSLESVQ